MAVFQTFRPDGRLQFDAGLMTMALIGRGVVSSQSRVAGATNPSSVLIPLPNLSDAIIIATQCSVGVARAGRYMNGSQPVAHMLCAGPIGTPVYYWLFGRSNSFPPTGTGLELFDPAGNLTYSSRRPVCTIAAIATDTGQTINLPAGRSYAAAAQEYTGFRRPSSPLRLYRDGRIWEPGDGGTGLSSWGYAQDSRLYGCMVNGATVQTGAVSFYDIVVTTGTSRTPIYPPADATWSRPMGTTLIVDVTGI